MKKNIFLAMFLVLVLASAVLAAPTNLALKKEYIVNREASPTYQDDAKLTDGVYSSAIRYSSPDFVGYNGQDPMIWIIDLKDVYKVDTVFANFLNEDGVGSLLPKMLSLVVSQDGKRWKAIDYQEYTEDNLPREGTYLNKYEFKIKGEKVRYVALKASSQFWLFIDEFEVIGDASSKEEAPKGYSLDDLDFEEIDFDF